MDRNLLDGLKKGNEKSYKIVFNNYYEWLCNYIYKLSYNYQLSEEIVQEVFVKLWENRERIVVKLSLKNYLFKACHNEFLQHIRKEKIKLDFLDSLRWDTLYEVYDTENNPKEKRLNALKKLIDELPPKCKEVFVKGKLEGKRYKGIAKDMNISKKTVEAQMSKALRYIRDQAVYLFL